MIPHSLLQRTAVKRLYLTGSCFVWLALATASRIMAGSMTITDGDFEAFDPAFATPPTTLNLNDWTFSNFAGIDTDTPGNPGRAVRLEAGGLATTDPTARQEITGLTIGVQYTLEWDWAMRINTSGAGNGPSFGVFLDSQSFANSLFLGTRLLSTYARDSATFVATSSSHLVIFAAELDDRSNGAGTTDVSYRLDNVSFAAVPEPGSATMVAVGCAFLITMAYRRSPRLPASARPPRP